MKKLLLALMASAAALLGACGGDTVPEGEAEINEIRIALLIDEGNPESGQVFEDFRQGLEDHIGLPVTIIPEATHLIGIEAMRAGNLEIMWGSPFVYLLADQATDAVRLAVTENPASINKAVFITAQDHIQSLSDIQGETFAFITPSSSSGFLYPMYHLMNEFGKDNDQILSGDFFSTVAFSGSQDASVMGVVHGDYAVAAVGNLNLQNFIASGMIQEDQVRILDSTEIIPFPGYIASTRVPEALRAQIQDFILAYDNDHYFEVRFRDPNVRFVEPNEATMDHLRSMVQALDIDLEEQ